MNGKKMGRAACLLLVLLLTLAGPPAAAAAADAEAPDAWALTEVEGAVGSGLVPADMQNGYRSDCTREDFCRLAVAFVEVRTETPVQQWIASKGFAAAPAFLDTSSPVIQAAATLGIVSGVGEGRFDPAGTLTREQAAAMLSRAAKVVGFAGTNPTSAPFADAGRISAWATEGVHFVASAGVMQGTGGNEFSPQGLYTRQQAYITMYRLLRAVKTGGEQAEMTAAQIYEAYSGSICLVTTYHQKGTQLSLGSGFAVDRAGKIVTNYHVIQNAYSAFVKFPDGNEYRVDQILSYDENRDVAVLKISAATNPVKIGDSDTIVNGQRALAIGNPYGWENTISDGLISTKKRVLKDKNYIQISIPISAGSSGGALFNYWGEVIGITSEGVEGAQNLNLAVPINEAKGHFTVDKGISVLEFFNSPHTGRLQYSNAVYTGTVAGGVENGYGICVWDDGDVYEGEWKDGKFHGHGVYVWADGERYEGEWADGVKNGLGTYYYLDGTVKSGQWINDRYVPSSAPVAPPARVRARAISSDEIEIGWDPVEGADYYKVYYSEDAVSWRSFKNPQYYEGEYSAALYGITSGTTLFFRVTAVSDGMESEPSLTVRATTWP